MEMTDVSNVSEATAVDAIQNASQSSPCASASVTRDVQNSQVNPDEENFACELFTHVTETPASHLVTELAGADTNYIDNSNSSWPENVSSGTSQIHTYTNDVLLPPPPPSPQPWKRILRVIAYVVILALYLVYVGFAVALNFQRSIPLVVLTSLVFLAAIWKSTFLWLRLRRKSRAAVVGDNGERHQQNPKTLRDGGSHTVWICGLMAGASSLNSTDGRPESLWERTKSVLRSMDKFCGRPGVKHTFYIVTVLCICGFLVSEHYNELDRLRPLLGLTAIIVVSLLVSYDRTQVNWRPVIWGLALQMCLGLLTLRTGPGRECFQYLGKQMEDFLDHVLAGVLFVFGFVFAGKKVSINIDNFLVCLSNGSGFRDFRKCLNRYHNHPD
ncbi:sodium/nucleoside cotransporter [Elysia marginata]|uniref:Sodium/nucleoside cotransporter n=1 Tax=Elysia marginata TaxID=1093978 RepID=A0AAV4GBE8_9GAST|nr:sodium/nucleoside cotransporter [Elysia marginata]